MGITPNAIYHSDCLAFLERIESEQVTLAYLDPPRSVGTGFVYGDKRETELREYWSFMSRVLQQVRRILSEAGSLYMHLEPRLTSHIRLILDQIFGVDNFRTEIIWPLRRMGVRVRPMVEHETIALYSKSDSFVYNPQFRPVSDDEVSRWYGHRDDKGPFRCEPLTSPVTRPNLQSEWKGFLPPSGQSWRYPTETLDQLDMEGRIYYPKSSGLPWLKTYPSDSLGIEIGSVWHDIPLVFPHNRECLGYPTQKPLLLLARIVKTGSNPGDFVLDPFCGTGTALVAAQANGRGWLGCDSNREAYSISVKRIESEFGLSRDADFDVGDQKSVESKFPIAASIYVPLVMPWGDHAPISEAPIAETGFVLNQPVKSEERRHCEFKEITGAHPTNSIKNTADEYVVAFLNSGEGGRILWGIRDDGTVVGVELNRTERDKLGKVLSSQLSNIQPSLDPTLCRIKLNTVYDNSGKAIPDLHVVEIVVPRVLSRDPYYTGGGEAWVKTDAGKVKLSGPKLTEWIKRRLSLDE